VERARAYWSGSLSMGDCLETASWIRQEFGAESEPHAVFCEDVARFIEDSRVQDDLEAEGEWETAVALKPLKALEEQLEGLLLAWVVLRGARRLDPDPFADLAFEVRHFCELLESSGNESAGIYEKKPGQAAVLRLVCLDPSRGMQPRLDAFAGSVLMSATLEPTQYHQDLLGLDPSRAQRLAFSSGWPVENRAVVLATRVSTAWKDREGHRVRTGELVRDLLASIPGTVAVYYPSYAMLRSIAPLCEMGDRESILQEPGLADEQRVGLVNRLSDTSRSCVLHAVLGGIFAEGIDLPGGVLKAVVVVGPALPPVGLERDLLRRWCEERYGQGFGYAFLVPGMSKVVQAAGRVVRGPEERGMVVLLGRRFGWRDYRALLPEDWIYELGADPVSQVEGFFGEE